MYEKKDRMDNEEKMVAYSAAFCWVSLVILFLGCYSARTGRSSLDLISPVSSVKAIYVYPQTTQVYGTGEKSRQLGSQILSPEELGLSSKKLKSPQPTYVLASWYGQEYCDKYSRACIAADGSRFDDTKLTAACDRRWSLGTVLSLTYAGKTIQVRCTDRGNFAKYGRSLDLSKGAFRALAPLSRGVIKVQVREMK